MIDTELMFTFVTAVSIVINFLLLLIFSIFTLSRTSPALLTVINPSADSFVTFTMLVEDITTFPPAAFTNFWLLAALVTIPSTFTLYK